MGLILPSDDKQVNEIIQIFSWEASIKRLAVYQ